MKKLISIAILAAFLAPLSIGCGDSKKPADTKPAEGSKKPPEEKKP